MDIFLLFVFNIFTGAVIFLILSLKIEKTSATFQEKKLRREMGEIITEFNSTAERNITLLENRISVLKKLMNDNGSVKGVDFTVLDDKMRDNFNQNIDLRDGERSSADSGGRKVKKKDSPVKKERIKNEQPDIIGSFMDKIQSFNKNEDGTLLKDKPKKIDFALNMEEVKGGYDSFSIIEKDMKDIQPKTSLIDLSADEEIILTYGKQETADQEPVDIEELFQNTDDKYILIARLFNEGHSIEDLAKHSGLPAGEIKLVISLNS